jgi:23S rRNA (adenine2503-C2)-methyltransferase
MAAALINLAALTKSELQAWTAQRGWTRYRAAQLWEWLYRRRATAFDVMTNLSVEMRAELARRACVRWPSVVERRVADDGTRKLLIELEDGRRIESVLIPDDRRLTLCLSTQVGCTLDCGFCLTGTMGLSRNLKAYEIVGQWVAARGELEQYPDGLPARITNVVFMGMGEPLANLPQLADALTRLTDPHGMAFPPRRITVSTAGLAPQIAELGRLTPAVNLAVSLNAADDATRAGIMPLAARYSLNEVISACRTGSMTRRRMPAGWPPCCAACGPKSTSFPGIPFPARRSGARPTTASPAFNRSCSTARCPRSSARARAGRFSPRAGSCTATRPGPPNGRRCRSPSPDRLAFC